ncbi:unnamed protein product [Brassicogethes aeneus]|uniref:ABC transporter domain-containing protein n=1 Tax=Brassicogethes aeneus TaxID=1431903 RepID=A0A9P0B5P6_BRAAE|nr:unnamed protein product [Brassicogethes aeneus]
MLITEGSAMGERVEPVVPGPDLVGVNVERPPLTHQQSTVWNKRQQAVCVRHAFKHYGSNKKPNHVLSNLNMTVAKGTIYGLLGASGCGKTTLLSCIVGRRRLNTGEIWVLGGKPGTKGSGVPGKRVGYMPQEIALYGEFSIKETMMYFGWIFGMESSEINERLQFLLNFLDLPSQNRLVKNLSGGQQRRVSFAVALMHDPELLILDEPTVGVDPLLRQSIWNHLVQITKDGNKTVIITTHYIEEARQAHTIGLMRSGKLLAEESPHVLLSMYGCQSLEEVFLKLSRKQVQGKENDVPVTVSQQTEQNIANNISLASLNWGKKDSISVTEESGVVGLNFHQSKEVLVHDSNGHLDKGKPSSSRSITDACDDCGSCTEWTTRGKIRALLQKNFLRMWRNVGVMLFIFALPVMQVILFCLAIGGDPKGLKLAIVNHEVPYTNQTYQHCDFFRNCSLTHMSCRYLDALNTSTMVKEYYRDPMMAKEAVRRGDAWGALYFTENFTDALVARMALGKDTDEETLDQSEIRVWLDMSNQQIGVILQRDIGLAFQAFFKEVLGACGSNVDIVDPPVSFKDPIYGNEKPYFRDFVAPGIILTVVFFLALALTSSALITERHDGLLDRAWVAGVYPWEVLFSHVLTQFVVMFGQTFLVLFAMFYVFDLECKGNMFLVFLLSMLNGLSGMCFGFVISAVCDLERNAIQLSFGQFLPHFASQWNSLASGGNALSSHQSIRVAALNYGHKCFEMHFGEGLGYYGTNCLPRIYFDCSLDLYFLEYQYVNT